MSHIESATEYWDEEKEAELMQKTQDLLFEDAKVTNMFLEDLLSKFA